MNGGFLKESGEDVGGGGSDRPEKWGTHSTEENEVFFLAEEDF